MQRAWKLHCNVHLNLKLLQLVSILSFSELSEIVIYDFENILQTQKFAMSEQTLCQTSHIDEEQINQGGFVYSEISKSKLKYFIYRSTYTVAGLKKSGW